MNNYLENRCSLVMLKHSAPVPFSTQAFIRVNKESSRKVENIRNTCLFGFFFVVVVGFFFVLFFLYSPAQSRRIIENY